MKLAPFHFMIHESAYLVHNVCYIKYVKKKVFNYTVIQIKVKQIKYKTSLIRTNNSNY